MNIQKRSDSHRGKYFSIILQPLGINQEKWTKLESMPKAIYSSDFDPDKAITQLLMSLKFPLWTEVKSVIEGMQVEKANSARTERIKNYAFGTEIGTKGRIPHYQIFIEFKVLVKTSSVRQNVEDSLGDRCFISIKKVFTSDYVDYCSKEDDVFTFESSYYWNVKIVKASMADMLVTRRPKLKRIRDSPYRSQLLTKAILASAPDDRSIYWNVDVIGGTGKTAGLQALIDEPDLAIMYTKITEGIERLSAKIRKRLNYWLEEKGAFPRTTWVNFGRTVTEDGLTVFSEVSENLIDGMLDDNFGNTGNPEWMALPYMHIWVTANTPPNLDQLTGDRWKIFTNYPFYEDKHDKLPAEVVMLPARIETQMCVQPNTKHHYVSIRYAALVISEQELSERYSHSSYYDQLLDDYKFYKETLKLKTESKGYLKSSYSQWREKRVTKLTEDEIRLHRALLCNMRTIKVKDVVKELETTVTSYDVPHMNPKQSSLIRLESDWTHSLKGRFKDNNSRIVD
jgi:hypothetical protein